MKTKLLASLMIGTALMSTTLVSPAFASAQSDQLTMMAAQIFAQQQAQAQAQAQAAAQEAYFQQLAVEQQQAENCAPAPYRYDHDRNDRGRHFDRHEWRR